MAFAIEANLEFFPVCPVTKLMVFATAAVKLYLIEHLILSSSGGGGPGGGLQCTEVAFMPYTQRSRAQNSAFPRFFLKLEFLDVARFIDSTLLTVIKA